MERHNDFDLAALENFVIDMDGVLWRGGQPMPGLAIFFAALRRRGAGFVLATNNASRTPADYVRKLAGFGVEIAAEQVLTSALATAGYLQTRFPAGARAYVIGDSGLREAVHEAGFEVVNGVTIGERNGRFPTVREADIVVAGIWGQAAYRDFAEATLCLNSGAALVGSNPDVSFPSEWGPLPGAGSIIALLATASGKEPTIVGKPGPLMFAQALARLNCQAATTAMIGDRLETDISGGQAAGLRTILVLSGIARREDIDAVVPDLVVEGVAELAVRLDALPARERHGRDD